MQLQLCLYFCILKIVYFLKNHDNKLVTILKYQRTLQPLVRSGLVCSVNIKSYFPKKFAVNLLLPFPSSYSQNPFYFSSKREREMSPLFLLWSRYVINQKRLVFCQEEKSTIHHEIKNVQHLALACCQPLSLIHI